MTTNRRRVIVVMAQHHQIVCYASLIFVSLALTNFGLTHANVINEEMDNMLRDASVTETDTAVDAAGSGGVFAGGRNLLANVATHQMLRNSETKQHLRKQNTNKFHDDIERNRISDETDSIDGNGVEVYIEGNEVADADTSSSSSDSVEQNNAAAVVHETSVELLRFVNDDENANERKSKSTTKETNAAEMIMSDKSSSSTSTLSLQDQVHLLTKQLNALMTRRREDYEILERNLRKSLRMETKAETVDLDIRNELEQLRLEVKSLRDNGQHAKNNNNNKERLTIEWLQQSVAELRKQLSELQQMANNAVKDLLKRRESYEDLATIRNDFQQLKLELIAIKERQEKFETQTHEIREEVLQQEVDTKRMLHNLQQQQQQRQQQKRNKQNNDSEEDENEETEVDMDSNNESADDELTAATVTADHKRRHCRFQRQQIHELQLTQRRMKHQMEELKFHRINERVRSIEIEQHRIAEANFNLSRQIASLDKLHTSMLELLEDVEGLQNKMDKNLPELRHEISKLEFSYAQLNSEQNLLREEGKNVARSVQAMAVSVSTLQEEREGVKKMQNSMTQLRTNVDRLESMMQDVQHALSHRNKKALKSEHQQHQTKSHQMHHHLHQKQQEEEQQKSDISAADYTPMTQRAESLVAKLENVEQQYESIINKLPQDCSEVSFMGSTSNNSADGLYMIAPAGQHRPLMAHCNTDGWTTIQRRYDGSADFNRSWEDYASGFGAPIGEYWIGNEQLHHLTLTNCTALRVIMQDIYDNTWVAEYDYFYISSRADGYRLHVGGYHGNASDALDYQQGMQFSAIDVDRDISQTHCAANYEGGWWFSHCQHANLNGRYNLGLTWFDAARNEWIAVKSSQMLIKRQSTSMCNANNSDSILTEADAPTATSSSGTTMSSISATTATATASVSSAV